MYIDSEVTHIRHLILSRQTEEARTALHDLLQSNPYYDQAWTLAAQLTSDPDQRKIFIKRVFDCSNNMELADWAFQNFGKLEMGLENEIPVPPVDYLAMENHRRIFLDELVDLALNPPEKKPQPANLPVFNTVSEPVQQNVSRSVEPIAPVISSMDRQSSNEPYRSSQSRNDPMAESTYPLFSLKTIGKWVIVGSGVLFIVIIYSDSFMRFFIKNRISPLYCCFIPLFLIGAAIMAAGYLTEKKK